MKAVVKVAYFDNSGLHKAGDVVEVKKLNRYLEATETEKVEKVEEPTEETVEIKTEKATKKATRKPTKKSKKV